MGDADAEIVCPVWTTKTPKAAQPNLNYIGMKNIAIFPQLGASAPLNTKSEINTLQLWYNVGSHTIPLQKHHWKVTKASIIAIQKSKNILLF